MIGILLLFILSLYMYYLCVLGILLLFIIQFMSTVINNLFKRCEMPGVFHTTYSGRILSVGVICRVYLTQHTQVAP
jgi:hypothetical protein